MVEWRSRGTLLTDARDADDDDRAAILRRRAVFVVSALAGIGLAGGCGDDASPQPCLSPMPPPARSSGVATATAESTVVSDAGPADAGPVDAGAADAAAADGRDGGSDADADAGAQDAGAPDAGSVRPVPRPCLNQTAPLPCLKKAPKPAPCLNF